MLSAQAKGFLAKYVSSAELLDILMLLHREPEGVWTPESVSARVFTVPQAAERRLDELLAHRLIKARADHPGAFTVDTSDPELSAAMAAVRESYDASRAEVIGAVFDRNADPLQTFSDAFRLRGGS
jgi:hypothetical protein